MKKLVRTMAKMPTLMILFSTGIFLTVLSMVGRNTLYVGQELDTRKMPVLALVFQGINEEKYPWQMFTGEDSKLKLTAQASEAVTVYGENILSAPVSGQAVDGEASVLTAVSAGSGTVGTESTASSMVGTESASTVSGSMEAESGLAVGETESAPATLAKEANDNGVIQDSGTTTEGNGTTKSTTVNGDHAMTGNAATNGSEAITENNAPPLAPIKPIRSTTREEALNYISADIYGLAGVERAGEFSFVPVTEDYFDDALFIGDSRTVGLRDYSSLSEHGDFLCATALTIFQVLETDIGKKGTVAEALAKNDYQKIYLSVGINELGRGTTEDYLEKYREVVDYLRKAEPKAIIVIQAVMKVTKEKNDGDAIINNSNIEARNRAIATLADNRQIFYIDVNEAMSDADGNLGEGYTHDGVHLLGSYIEDVKQFLLNHGVMAGAE